MTEEQKPKESDRVTLVNVSHHNFGGYDFNGDGKVDHNERFDCGPDQSVTLTRKRAEMLLRDHSDKFMPEAAGRKVIAERIAMEQKEARRRQDQQKKILENLA